MNWITGICLTCIGGGILRLCTLRDPNSGTGRAMRFLSSLILILVVISPFLSPLPDEIPLPQGLLWEESAVDAAAMLLEKSTDRIRQDASSAFPELSFSLEARSDGEKEPYLILTCRDEAEGKLLCDYIQTKFQLTCRITERK